MDSPRVLGGGGGSVLRRSLFICNFYNYFHVLVELLNIFHVENLP